MLQCYVLTCGRSVTAFLAPPGNQRPGQGPRLPHPKAGPVYVRCVREVAKIDYYFSHICPSVRMEQVGYRWADFLWNLVF
jgi:hypothetical protein